MARRFANQLHAAAHLEFCQQGRNVEFNGTFRQVEIRRNFFVRQTLRDAGQNLFLAAGQAHLAMNGPAGFEQLVGFLNQIFQNLVFGLHQNGVVSRTLAANKAMHGEEPGCLIYGKTTVGPGLYMKMGYSRILFVKEENIAVRYGPSS